jgi:hypothetical protein
MSFTSCLAASLQPKQRQQLDIERYGGAERGLSLGFLGMGGLRFHLTRIASVSRGVLRLPSGRLKCQSFNLGHGFFDGFAIGDRARHLGEPATILIAFALHA